MAKNSYVNRIDDFAMKKPSTAEQETQEAYAKAQAKQEQETYIKALTKEQREAYEKAFEKQEQAKKGVTPEDLFTRGSYEDALNSAGILGVIGTGIGNAIKAVGVGISNVLGGLQSLYSNPYGDENSLVNQINNAYFGSFGNNATTDEGAKTTTEQPPVVVPSIEGQQSGVATPSATPSQGTGTPYDGLLKTIKESYDYATKNLENAKDRIIDQAYKDYERSTNPYGVIAENLAGAGLTRNGGYGQRLNEIAFNSTQNRVAEADNAYADALKEIELAKSSNEANLAYEKYVNDMNEAKNAYANALSGYQLTTNAYNDAFKVASSLWNKKTNKKANTEEMVEAIQNDSRFKGLTDAQISAIIQAVINQPIA